MIVYIALFYTLGCFTGFFLATYCDYQEFRTCQQNEDRMNSEIKELKFQLALLAKKQCPVKELEKVLKEDSDSN